MERSPSASGVERAALLGIVAAAVLLRMSGFGHRTLSWDEAYHVELISLPTVGEMLGAILANPPSDPLYALFLRGWSTLLGTSDPMLRVPSIVFGAATVLAAAWLAWELTRNRRTALVAALLAAVAPYVVEFGQEATPYVFATLWTTLALAAGWRWRRTGRGGDAALAIVFAIVAVYGHYAAAPILGLAALLSAITWAGPGLVSRRGVLAAAAVVLIAWLPWLVPMVASWLSAPFPRTAVHSPATVTELMGAVSQYSSGSGALLEAIRPLQVLGAVAAAVLLLRGWLVGEQPHLRGLRIVLVVGLVLLVGPWLASVLTGRWLFAPHLILLLLPALLVVAAAGGTIPGVGRARQIATPALVALVAFVVAQWAGLWVNAVYPPRGNEGVRELVDVLEAQVAEGEPVFVTPPEHSIVVARYWDGPLVGLPADLDLTRIYGRFDLATAAEESIARFEEVAGGATRAWIIYGPHYDLDARLTTHLRQQGDLRFVETYPIADLYVVDLR